MFSSKKFNFFFRYRARNANAMYCTYNTPEGLDDNNSIITARRSNTAIGPWPRETFATNVKSAASTTERKTIVIRRPESRTAAARRADNENFRPVRWWWAAVARYITHNGTVSKYIYLNDFLFRTKRTRNSEKRTGERGNV